MLRLVSSARRSPSGSRLRSDHGARVESKEKCVLSAEQRKYVRIVFAYLLFAQ